jgi:hypothetical protein
MHTLQSVKRSRGKMDVQNLETARTYNVNVCVMLGFGAGVVETTPGDANSSWVEQLSRLWNDTSNIIWRQVLLNSYSRDITGVTIDSSKAAVIAVDDDNFAFSIAEAQTPGTMKASMCANSITKPRNAWGVESVECRGCCAKYCSHLSICSYLAYAIVQAVGKKHNEIAIDGDTVHRGKPSIASMPIAKSIFVLTTCHEPGSRFGRMAHLERRTNTHKDHIVNAIGVNHGDGMFGMKLACLVCRICSRIIAHMHRGAHIKEMRNDTTARTATMIPDVILVLSRAHFVSPHTRVQQTIGV